MNFNLTWRPEFINQRKLEIRKFYDWSEVTNANIYKLLVFKCDVEKQLKSTNKKYVLMYSVYKFSAYSEMHSWNNKWLNYVVAPRPAKKFMKKYEWTLTDHKL